MKYIFRRVLLPLFSLILVCAFGADAFSQTPPALAHQTKQATLDRDFDLDPVDSGETQKMRVLALRLRPGQDLRHQIETFVKAKRLRAGFIITTVGSLRRAAIRLADQPTATTFEGKFEIVSLVGTLGQDGIHLHIAISDNTGKTIGGHLVEGCLIYTTAEIVIGNAEGLVFSREKDAQTTFQELKIRKAKPAGRH